MNKQNGKEVLVAPVKPRERRELIEVAYEGLDEEVQAQVDFVADQLETGIKMQDGYISYGIGAKSARELTWALCRYLHEALACER